MPRLPGNIVTASIAWYVLRHRLRRSDHLLAPVGVTALETLGPRVLLARRLAAIAIGLTIVGLVAIGVVWWLLHQRGAGNGGEDGRDDPEPEPEPTPPSYEVHEPATPVVA